MAHLQSSQQGLELVDARALLCVVVPRPTYWGPLRCAGILQQRLQDLRLAGQMSFSTSHAFICTARKAAQLGEGPARPVVQETISW